jgi:exopolysaccharide production protein ExoZ
MEQGKLPGLQVARAIAALAVVYYHSWTALTGFPPGTSYPLSILATDGWLGVDLFFAISGFVIGLVLSKATFDPAKFLIKRAFRIYPLWLLTLGVFILPPLLWRAPTESETLVSFLHSASLVLTEQPPHHNVGWSLQHEIAFYVMAAVVVPIFGIGGLAIVLFASSMIYYLGVDAPWYVVNLSKYHAEFLAGLIAFLCRGYFVRFGVALPLAIGVGSLALFLHVLPVADGRPFAPISLLFLIVGFVNMRSTAATRPLEKLGDASFSMYLLHPFVLVVPKIVTRYVTLPVWSQEFIRVGCIAVIIAISLASWRFFEKAMIGYGNRAAASVGSLSASSWRFLSRQEAGPAAIGSALAGLGDDTDPRAP